MEAHILFLYQWVKTLQQVTKRRFSNLSIFFGNLLSMFGNLSEPINSNNNWQLANLHNHHVPFWVTFFKSQKNIISQWVEALTKVTKENNDPFGNLLKVRFGIFIFHQFRILGKFSKKPTMVVLVQKKYPWNQPPISAGIDCPPVTIWFADCL